MHRQRPPATFFCQGSIAHRGLPTAVEDAMPSDPSLSSLDRLKSAICGQEKHRERARRSRSAWSLLISPTRPLVAAHACAGCNPRAARVQPATAGRCLFPLLARLGGPVVADQEICALQVTVYDGGVECVEVVNSQRRAHRLHGRHKCGSSQPESHTSTVGTVGPCCRIQQLQHDSSVATGSSRAGPSPGAGARSRSAGPPGPGSCAPRAARQTASRAGSTR